MELEDQLTSVERLKQGIFFTKPEIVKEIINNFDFKGINSVIDTAAGSCNFLIPLARKFPNITFYGIEKNPFIYRETLKEISSIPNIKFFLGDCLLNSFSIPKCDLYIGNPPFINFSDLEPEYRDKIKPLWLSFFPESKGFKMLLGESRGDISQLIFYYTINKYLQDNGSIGVILPNALIMGNSASSGFRDFKNITILKLVDISTKNPFDNTSRNCFYILANKGGETKFPIIYNTQGKEKKLVKIGTDLMEESNSIIKNSPYVARQGINTLGANSIFFFKNKPLFNSRILKPLLKSSDINPFKCNPSYYILLPYNETGGLLLEDELKKDFPEEYKYLLSHKKALDSRKSRFAQKHWYGLFGVGDYTFTKYKVVWRGLGAREMMASVTDKAIPNQAMNCYISTNDFTEANYICGIMNSQVYKNQLLKLNESGAKSFAQPNTINKIYIPLYTKSALQIEISEISISGHFNTENVDYLLLEKKVVELYRNNGFIIDQHSIKE